MVSSGLRAVDDWAPSGDAPTLLTTTERIPRLRVHDSVAGVASAPHTLTPPRVCRPVRAQDGPQISAGADAELRIDLAQVPLDRARAEEQLRTYLRIREPFRGEPRDLGFLSGETARGAAGDGGAAR